MGFNPGAGSPPPKDDDERTWRELVARLEADGDGGGARGDGSTGTHPAAASTVDDAAGPKGVADFDPLGVWQQNPAPAPTELPAGQRFQSSPAVSGPRDYEAPEGDDDGFVPPELPSLGSSEPAILLSWLGAAGGPLFLVFAAIFWRSIPLVVTIGVIMAFLGGTGYLLSRLPNHRDHDGGDGAVV